MNGEPRERTWVRSTVAERNSQWAAPDDLWDMLNESAEDTFPLNCLKHCSCRGTGMIGPEKTVAALREYIAAFLEANLLGKPTKSDNRSATVVGLNGFQEWVFPG